MLKIVGDFRKVYPAERARAQSVHQLYLSASSPTEQIPHSRRFIPLSYAVTCIESRSGILSEEKKKRKKKQKTETKLWEREKILSIRAKKRLIRIFKFA